MSHFDLPQSKPLLFLAPMEGVADWPMRALLSSIGGMDYCVGEFLRVSDQVLPKKEFFKNCPELLTQSQTTHGVPVILQLLGGNPDLLSQNALRAVELGATAIDLNFGCPAKTVNRHDGGATLLQYPERVFNIVSSVRKVLPAHIPLSAKIRLGFANTDLVFDNAQAAASAGIRWLTVHARTKTDGYKPPAYWEFIPRIQEKISVPVVANGEIWSYEDFKKCQAQTGSEHFMLGRGAVANPFLFQEITGGPKASWQNVLPLLPQFYKLCEYHHSPQFAVARMKNWLGYMRRNFDDAEILFQRIKVITNPTEFSSQIRIAQQ